VWHRALDDGSSTTRAIGGMQVTLAPSGSPSTASMQPDMAVLVVRNQLAEHLQDPLRLGVQDAA